MESGITKLARYVLLVEPRAQDRRRIRMNLKRALFNLYFYIAPGAATRWLNFKFDVAESLDNMEIDEN